MKPRAYFVVGLNGSGKSTIRNTLVLPKDIVIIDADKIAKDFGISGIKAGKLAIKRFEQSLNERKSFLLESTLSGKSSILRMKRAKEQGYTIKIYFIGLDDVSLNIDRVNNRVEKGGHKISTEVIERRYTDTFDNLDKLPEISDLLKVYDNSSENNPFHKKAEFIRGKIKYIDFDLEEAIRLPDLTKKNIKKNKLFKFLFKTACEKNNLTYLKKSYHIA